MSGEIKLSVSALVVDEAKDFLLVQEGHGGLYNMPGGGLKKHETWLDAVFRETLEESGLEVRPDFLVGAYQCVRNAAGHNMARFVVACTKIGGEITASDKHPAVEYYPLKQIKEFKKKGLLQNDGLLPSVKDYLAGKGTGLEFLSKVKKHKKR